MSCISRLKRGAMERMSMTLLASHRLRLVEWSHRDNSEGDRELAAVLVLEISRAIGMDSKACKLCKK